MKYIHPFPARMAPEIVLKKLKSLKEGQSVLDPMVGSGMVLHTASRMNIYSYGMDLDPLAVLISKVASTKIDVDTARDSLKLLIEKSMSTDENVFLPWIDGSEETLNFINYWFDKKQIRQLRTIAYNLIQKPVVQDNPILDILKISLSRLIITKEPKASLARDTAHSRPHKTIDENDFNIFDALPISFDSVLKALKPENIKCNSYVSIGDARKLNQIEDNQFDLIITSPPYLNAIDYMRGHKFSLVWLGYTLSELRNIRSTVIGAEKKIDLKKEKARDALLKRCKEYDLNSPMIQKYFLDLYDQLFESYRVLKTGGDASYVIGNSNIKGNIVYNNKLLKAAANAVGFIFFSETKREIPNSRRYMPIGGNSSLSNRMKMEYIISFKKP